jgi:ankyrin repeat protein
MQLKKRVHLFLVERYTMPATLIYQRETLADISESTTAELAASQIVSSTGGVEHCPTLSAVNHSPKTRADTRAEAKIIPCSQQFWVKTLRADAFGSSGSCLAGCIPTDDGHMEHQKLRPYPKKNYTVNGEGVSKRRQSWSVIPITYSSIPYKQPQYTAAQKHGFSQLQSVSVATVTSPVSLFGHDRYRRNKLIGVMGPLEDALPGRSFAQDYGTMTRPYDFDDLIHAKTYYTIKIKLYQLFKDSAALISAIEFGTLPFGCNEVLARIRLTPKSRVLVGADSFEARALAVDLQRRIETYSARVRTTSIKLPIVFYLPEQNTVPLFLEYSSEEQALDRAEALSIYKNDDRRSAAYENSDFEFLLLLDSDTLVEACQEPASEETLLIRILKLNFKEIFQSICEITKGSWNKILPEALLTIISSDIVAQMVHHSLLCHDVELTAYLLNNTHYSLDKRINDEETVLHLIARKKHQENSQQFYSIIIDRICWPNLQGNKAGYTALHLAAKTGNLGLIQCLEKKPRFYKGITMTDPNNNTAVDLAAANGHLDILKFLFNYVNSDILLTLQNNALRAAAANGHNNIIEFLFEKSTKIDVNSTDQYGQTALHLAVGHGHVPTVKLLLDRGDIDVNLRTKGGKSPLWVAAIISENGDITELLLRRIDIKPSLKYQLRHGGERAVYNREHGESGTILDDAFGLPARNDILKQLVTHPETELKSYAITQELHFKRAVIAGDVDTLELLLASHVATHSYSEQLYLAVENKQFDVVKWLLARFNVLNATIPMSFKKIVTCPLDMEDSWTQEECIAMTAAFFDSELQKTSKEALDIRDAGVIKAFKWMNDHGCHEQLRKYLLMRLERYHDKCLQEARQARNCSSFFNNYFVRCEEINTAFLLIVALQQRAAPAIENQPSMVRVAEDDLAKHKSTLGDGKKHIFSNELKDIYNLYRILFPLPEQQLEPQVSLSY